MTSVLKYQPFNDVDDMPGIRHLQDTFRMEADPIIWDASQQAYVAAFVARDERPKREREQWLRELAERRRR